jgi:hypothetical protein
VSEGAQLSAANLHKLWVKMENECHQLATAIGEAMAGGADATLLRDRQARLLVQISSLVAQIRAAPAVTIEDYLALLDVAIEHEIDLALEIAFYGAEDFPMITRLLRALARTIPGFEFNSLRRAMSSPGQFEELMNGGLDGREPIGIGCR